MHGELRCQLRPEVFHGRLSELRDVIPLRDPIEIQRRLDHVEELDAGVAYASEDGHLLVRTLLVGEHIEVADDHVERRSELVGHRRDEFRLELARSFGGLEQSDVRECVGSQLGNSPKELDFSSREACGISTDGDEADAAILLEEHRDQQSACAEGLEQCSEQWMPGLSRTQLDDGRGA